MHPKNLIAATIMFFTLAGLLFSQGGSPFSQRNHKQIGDVDDKTDPADLYFYGGENGTTKIPLTMDTTRVLVRVNQNFVGMDRMRQVMEMTGGIQSGAEDPDVTENGFAFMPMMQGSSSAQVQNACQTMMGDPSITCAAPVYMHNGEMYAENDEIIVAFDPVLAQSDIDGIIATHNLNVVSQMSGDAYTYVLSIPPGHPQSSLEIANMFIEQYGEGFVLYSHPNFVIQRELSYTPNDTYYNLQWHLNATGSRGDQVDADVDAPEAWDLQQGDNSITIAVIDEGTDLSHPDLNLVTGWDAINNNNNPDARSGESHGTAVSGIAAAIGDNGIGVAGACMRCKVMPIRLIVAGMQVSDEAESFDFAWQNGADIINNSWGPVSAGVSLPPSTKAAIDRAVTQGRGGKGCVVLFASGNSNRNVDNDGYASYSEVLAIGASTDQDVRASYSNYGSTLDFCAPSSGGTNGTVTTDVTGSGGYVSGDYVDGFGGTSSACPLAAGVVGLMLTEDPNLTYTDVYTHLKDTADKIDQSGGNYQNGHSWDYGWGKVNAFDAVSAVQGGGGGPGDTTKTYVATDVPKSIPDNDPGGVTSNMSISDSGPIVSMTAYVDISHTYIGDLVVTLIAPDGSSTILHNRSGGSSNDINQTYNVSAFNGKNLNGNWQLFVQDFARFDTGSIDDWDLTITYTPDGGGGGPGDTTETFNSTDTPLSIPDNNTGGVTSNLFLSRSGSITAASCAVDISHTYIGDLVITLTHPDGTDVVLWNRQGGSADDIDQSFNVDEFIGKGLSGTFKLKVQDLAGLDVGTLNTWSLTLTYSDGGGGGGGTWTFNSSDVPWSVPDNNSNGIFSGNSASGTNGTIVEVNVTVNITHTYKGDLKVRLYHPDGTDVLLHNRTGGSANNINTTYDTLTIPYEALSAFNGKTGNGNWLLQVSDHARIDTGTLNSWSVQIITQ